MNLFREVQKNRVRHRVKESIMKLNIIDDKLNSIKEFMAQTINNI